MGVEISNYSYWRLPVPRNILREANLATVRFESGPADRHSFWVTAIRLPTLAPCDPSA